MKLPRAIRLAAHRVDLRRCLSMSVPTGMRGITKGAMTGRRPAAAFAPRAAGVVRGHLPQANIRGALPCRFALYRSNSGCSAAHRSTRSRGHSTQLIFGR